MTDDSDRSKHIPARAPLPDAWWDLPLLTRRQIAAAVAVVLVLGVGWLTMLWTSGDSSEPIPALYVAELPLGRVATWDRLAECESSGRWDLDTGNGFAGGLQFTQSSWIEVGGAGSPAAASRDEQIMRAEFLYERQGWDAWPSCSTQLGLSN